MLNALAPDQCTGKNSAKFSWPFSRPETFDIHAPRQIKQFFLRESPYAKRVGRRRDARWGSQQPKGYHVALPLSASANSPPTNYGRDRSARWPDAGTRSNRDIFSSRHSNRADREMR